MTARNRDFVCMAGLFVLALYWRIDFTFPPVDGVSCLEEAQSGELALLIIRGYRPWEFFVSRWLGVLGVSIGGFNLPALRAPFMVVSALAVPLLYGLCRELRMTWPVALTTAALLAVSHWAILYGRMAHNVFPEATLLVGVWWLVVRIVRGRGGLWAYAVLGVLCAETWSAYAGYRITSPLVAPALLYHAYRTRSYKGLLCWMVITAVGLAIALWYVRNDFLFYIEAMRRSYTPDYYTPDWGTWIELRRHRLWMAVRLFGEFGDTRETMNLPGEPMLDRFVYLWFCVGIIHALIRGYRAWIWWWLLAVGLVLFLGAMVVTHNFDPCRLGCMVPLVFLFVGCGLDLIRKQMPRWVTAIMLIVAVLFSAGVNRDVLADMPLNQHMQRAYHYPHMVLNTALQSLPPHTYVYTWTEVRNYWMPSDFEWLRRTDLNGEIMEMDAPIPDSVFLRPEPHVALVFQGKRELHFPCTVQENPTWPIAVTVCLVR